MNDGQEAMIRLNPPVTGPRRFDCPECGAKRCYPCTRKGGVRFCNAHPAREALWRAWQADAPMRLAWIEDQALPWLVHVTEEYLIGGKRPNRRKTDIAIAGRRAAEARVIMERAH